MSTLSHIDESGRARMVDVSGKAVSVRLAVASAQVQMLPDTLGAIRENTLAKGDVLAVARIAGIQAAKRCDTLIPLCHALPLEGVTVEFELDDALPGVRIEASARVSGKTGVEMEALTAASIAALTIYDMCKAVDREMVITELMLQRKEGGRSGLWERLARTDSVAESAGRTRGARSPSDGTTHENSKR